MAPADYRLVDVDYRLVGRVRPGGGVAEDSPMTRGTDPSSPPARSVLLLDPQAERRARFGDALREAGLSVREAARIADVDRWPSGETVITDAERFTGWWHHVGAKYVIVLASDEHEGKKACSSGANAWLPRTCGAEVLVQTVVELGSGRRR
jgi:hypothetical protein